ncbi:MAG: 4Fe-4S binding protein [Leptospirales bacterium]|nr:4Fe-4S binding protein [Leptospirales bacterium]
MRRDEFFTRGWKVALGDWMRTPLGGILDRRLSGLANFLSPRGLQQIAEEAGVAGQPAYESDRNFSRPPGADAQRFHELCTACGDCIRACPYGVLFSQGPKSGPLLEPNLLACRLCQDYPCIEACATGALVELPADVLPRFGQATAEAEACVNARPPEKGRRRRLCRECIESCPVEGAVSLRRSGVAQISEHCTGCGICVAHCPGGAIHVTVGE